MTKQEHDATNRHFTEDPDRRYLFTGLLGIAMMYAAMGLLMMLISNVFATLPLNTPAVFDAIGRMEHVYGVRLGTSTAFFVLAGLTIIVAVQYSLEPADKLTRWYARVLAMLMQPWIYLAALVIGVLWVLQAIEPDGDIAALFSGMLGINNESYYRYLMGTMPSLAFIMFGIGGFIIMPFLTNASDFLLQDTGVKMGKARTEPMPFIERSRVFAAKNMLRTGIIFMFVGVALYAIGYVLGMGLDITWPFFKLENYPLFMAVYPWFPVACGGVCIGTAILYFARHELHASRALAWCTVVLGCVLPIYGWYSSIVMGRELLISGEMARTGKEKKEMYVGVMFAAVSIITSAIYVLILSA